MGFKSSSPGASPRPPRAGGGGGGGVIGSACVGVEPGHEIRRMMKSRPPFRGSLSGLESSEGMREELWQQTKGGKRA